ncbi:MAG: hypothetical protein E7479_04515 [Ruminococcaceae bacterium]|nr:hypothetical protein [Oscillospiraceae bacterium]
MRKITIFYPTSLYNEVVHDSEDTTRNISKELVETSKVINALKVSVDLAKRLPTTSKKKDFMNKIMDESTDILMAWRGGYVLYGNSAESSIELVWDLEDKDYEIIKNSKKKIVGKSDLTYLFNNLLNNDIECFYGPNFESNFVEEDSALIEIEMKYMLDVLSDEEVVLDFSEEKNLGTDVWLFNSGKVTGRIVGGNLDTIYTAMKDYPKTSLNIKKGDLVLLEEVSPTYYSDKDGNFVTIIGNKLDFLKENGFFDYVGGIIFGKSKKPEHHIVSKGKHVCTDEEERELLKLMLKKLDLLNVPVIANVPCSHTHPMVTVPLGRTVTLDADNKTLIIHKKNVD